MAESSIAQSASEAPLPATVHPRAKTPDKDLTSKELPIVGESGGLSRKSNQRKRRRSSSSDKDPLNPAGRTAAEVAAISISPLVTLSKAAATASQASTVLTAAAEIASQKRRRENSQHNTPKRSPNLQRQALGQLMGAESQGMSRVEDAPTSLRAPDTSTVDETSSSAAASTKAVFVNATQTSPVSTSSAGTTNAIGIGSLLANGRRVASPSNMDTESMEGGDREDDEEGGEPSRDGDEGHSNKAMSYPNPHISARLQDDQRRGMSLPHSGLAREHSRSPSTSSNKKHKCPYCSTEFTRHHNLKSHLLTHSQEKPYLCQTCDSRFRRIHDLKRHTKLHTGERSHVCPQCKRRFARGDALARHSKGQGGCPGRRSSAGGHGADASFDSSYSGQGGDRQSMDGLMYTGQGTHEPEDMDEDEGTDRRQSLPTIRKHKAPDDPHSHHHHQHTSSGQSDYSHPGRTPSTYPPVATRQPTVGGLYPPPGGHTGGPNSNPSSGGPSSPLNPYHGTSPSSSYSSANAFAPIGMTESPKPISPLGSLGPPPAVHADTRNRSPSLTAQYQQHHFGRRIGGSGDLSSQQPLSAPQMTAAAPPQTLPPLAGFVPPDARYSLQSQSHTSSHPQASNSLTSVGAAPSGSSSYHSQIQANATGPSSHSNSHSSHASPHGSGHGGGERREFRMSNEDRLWAYLHSLENKIDSLRAEVETLKGQNIAPPPPGGMASNSSSTVPPPPPSLPPPVHR
ncbi:hypothetical protein MMC25_004798 [Agyrium rufum]|nr:hypothetical protein [Agyrium rufum]